MTPIPVHDYDHTYRMLLSHAEELVLDSPSACIADQQCTLCYRDAVQTRRGFRTALDSLFEDLGGVEIVPVHDFGLGYLRALAERLACVEAMYLVEADYGGLERRIAVLLGLGAVALASTPPPLREFVCRVEDFPAFHSFKKTAPWGKKNRFTPGNPLRGRK